MQLFGTKEMCITYECSEMKTYFLLNLMYFSQRNIVLDPPFPYIDSFLRRDRVQLHINFKRVILQNGDVPATVKPER
jgi:hypothetical protein